MLHLIRLILLTAVAAFLICPLAWSQGPASGGQFTPRPAAAKPTAAVAQNPNTVIQIKGGFVTSTKDVELAAKEPGILAKVDIKPGDEVEVDTLLANMDDKDALIRVEAAEAELAVATTQAESEAELKAAVHTVGVAKAEYETTINIKKRNPEAISDTQLRRDELQWRKAIAQEELARMEHIMHGKTVLVKQAQLNAAKNELDKRQIKSSVRGVVEDIFKDEGEWCPLGERLVRVVQMDRLRVVGFVQSKYGHQDDVLGRRVEITIQLPSRTDAVQVSGVVDFASPVVANNEFRVHVDIDNKKDERTGRWMISPGVRADISIDMVQPAVSRNVPAVRDTAR